MLSVSLISYNSLSSPICLQKSGISCCDRYESQTKVNAAATVTPTSSNLLCQKLSESPILGRFDPRQQVNVRVPQRHRGQHTKERTELSNNTHLHFFLLLMLQHTTCAPVHTATFRVSSCLLLLLLLLHVLLLLFWRCDPGRISVVLKTIIKSMIHKIFKKRQESTLGDFWAQNAGHFVEPTC